MQWFRFYTEALNDPKVQKLDAEIFRCWVNLLCVTSHSDGSIVTCDIPFHLRTTKIIADVIMQRLVDADLMVEEGDCFIPKNWSKRQFKSDTSADRMRHLRAKKKSETCDVTSTVTVTRSETETETEIKKNTSYSKKAVTGTRLPEDWVLPDEWGDWAMAYCQRHDLANGMPFVVEQGAMFKNYWVAKTGAGSTKRDWKATWENWIRKGLPDYVLKQKRLERENSYEQIRRGK